MLESFLPKEITWTGACASLLSLLLLYLACLLIGRIVFPTIILHPWALPVSRNQQKKDKTMTVVLAGSYNPPHYGHLHMLKYLAERFGQVIVVVGMNPDKKYLVSPEERAQLLRRMIQEERVGKNVKVEVVQGYIWRTVKRMGARIFFRGIRSWEKDGVDERSLQILNTWGPLLLGPLWWPLPTIFLEGKPEYNHVSSTLIRNLCKDGKAGEKELKTLVPPCIANDVAIMYSR